MESRMEKYYKEDLSTFERSKKNEKLYKDVYREISDLENLPVPDNSNEIDMDGLKQIISSRDEYRKKKELDKTFTSAKPLVEEPKPKQDTIEMSIPMPAENNVTSNTNSLPLDILMDLKGSDNTVVTDPIVKEEVTMIKKIKDGETFYSGSFSFTKKDFDEISEGDEELLEDDSHIGLKIFFLIIGILILIGAVYLILTKYVL